MMNLGVLADKFLKKEWSDEDVQKYVGDYEAAYLTYSDNIGVRRNAASGGTTSSLLINSLREGVIDGAVVCKVIIKDERVRPCFYIARTETEVLDAQGSKYVETKFLRDVLPLCREFEGKLAVVGLPCDITALKRRCSKEEKLKNKIAITIALVCGHNSRTDLIDHVSKNISIDTEKKLTDYRFRVGHWRGRLEADFQDGTTISKPSKFFNDYQNLFFFCERKCIACTDHYGYHADISVGDVWLFRLKDDPIKHSGLIIRTEAGEKLFQSSFDGGRIIRENLDIRDIMDGQSRIGPSHYNVSARVRAGRLFSMKLKDTVNEPVTWHAYLNAFITIANMRLSDKSWGKKLIFIMPRPILKLGLYFKKALESLK